MPPRRTISRKVPPPIPSPVDVNSPNFHPELVPAPLRIVKRVPHPEVPSRVPPQVLNANRELDDFISSLPPSSVDPRAGLPTEPGVVHREVVAQQPQLVRQHRPLPLAQPAVVPPRNKARTLRRVGNFYNERGGQGVQVQARDRSQTSPALRPYSPALDPSDVYGAPGRAFHADASVRPNINRSGNPKARVNLNKPLPVPPREQPFVIPDRSSSLHAPTGHVARREGRRQPGKGPPPAPSAWFKDGGEGKAPRRAASQPRPGAGARRDSGRDYEAEMLAARAMDRKRREELEGRPRGVSIRRLFGRK